MSLTGNGTAPIDAMCSKDDDLAGNIVMGLLGLGTFLSYVPAWYEVVANRSSRGISVTSIFLLNFTNYATTLGVLLQNWVALVCCDNGEFDTGECLAGINPIFLVGANVAGCIPLYILTLIFFDEDGDDDDSSPKAAAPNSSSSTGLKKQSSRRASDDDACSDVSATSSTFPQQLLDVPENRLVRFTSKRQALGSFAAFIVIVGITSIVSAVLIVHTGYDSNYTQRYADASNIAAAIAMVLTWLPQILHTYRLKDVGSLSIITLAIQAPGAASVCISLILDGQELSSIASNAVASVCLFFLVAQCIKYKYCAKKPESRADDTLALDPELGRSYGSCEDAETDVNNGPLVEDGPPGFPGAKLSTITSPPANPCSPLSRLGGHCSSKN